MSRAFGPVLGVRRLSIVPSGRRVTVMLGKPRKATRHWECPFRITGLRVPRVQHGYGVDAIQALANALEGVRVTLERSRTRLSWFEPDDAGFERTVPRIF